MTDVWETLRRSPLPCVLYGMGDGGDKMISQCEKRGIAVSGVFASDEFVRGQSFHGFTVTTYAGAKEKFGKMNVLLAFASDLIPVMENIDRIDREMPLFAPDLPVAGETVFDASFYEAHLAEHEAARALFADPASLDLFDRIVIYRLTGKLSFLRPDRIPEEAWPGLPGKTDFRTAIDLGAYTGDTAIVLAARSPDLQKLICVEPDPKTFEKLVNNVASLPAVPVNAAAWNEEGETSFRKGGSRSSRIGDGKGNGKTVTVRTLRPDSLLPTGEKCDFIKYDVEGAEYEAIIGSERFIKEGASVCAALYHRPEDLFRLPLLLKKMNPAYSFRLVRARYYPAWELNLFADVKP